MSPTRIHAVSRLDRRILAHRLALQAPPFSHGLRHRHMPPHLPVNKQHPGLFPVFFLSRLVWPGLLAPSPYPGRLFQAVFYIYIRIFVLNCGPLSVRPTGETLEGRRETSDDGLGEQAGRCKGFQNSCFIGEEGGGVSPLSGRADMG